MDELERRLPQQIIATHYATRVPAATLHAHGKGGFSGARIWRVESAAGCHCLRKWPAEHPSAERLRFIHDVLHHAQRGACDRLAVPLPTTRGDSFVQHNKHLWELAPWLPGQPATPDDVTAEQIAAALEALAEFHRATANYPGNRSATDHCPAVNSRLAAIERFERLTLHLNADQLAPEFRPVLLAFRSRRERLRHDLLACRASATVLQPCLRDIWSDHVLFEGNLVSGVIDYGAMQLDTRLTDIARLLGSYAENRPEFWRAGIAAYRQQLPLDDNCLELVAALDLSTAVLSGMNWLVWLQLEQRKFSDPAAVAERVKAITRRLTGLPTSVEDHWLRRVGG